MDELSGHRKALGWFHLLVGLMSVLASGDCLARLVRDADPHGRSSRGMPWEGLPVVILAGFAAFVLALALAELSLGAGLVRGRRVSRGLGLFLGVLSLPTFPLGTVLGLYTLWFFTREGWDAGLDPPGAD